MRIAFIISSLACGGAEKVVCSISNHLIERGHAITIYTFDRADSIPFFSLDSRIKLYNLNLQRDSKNLFQGLWANIKRFSNLRRELKQAQPDCIVSFMYPTTVLGILLGLSLGIPCIISERVDPQSTQYRVRFTWHWMRRVFYRFAKVLVVPTRQMQTYFSNLAADRVKVIENPVSASTSTGRIAETEKLILAIGRLQPQKGFDLLIWAVSLVAKEFPDWKLVIVGEGPERANLENLINRLGLVNNITLVGQVQDLSDLLCNATMFVLSSRFEGFPNVLCEAMAAGLPVIAFDCPTGPREIIDSGVNGILVPAQDHMGLAQAMIRLIKDANLRRQLGVNAGKISERFSAHVILQKWEEVLVGNG